MRSLIAAVRALLVLLALAAPLPALAATYTDTAALDALFAQLKAAQSADEASAITLKIWQAWFSPNIPALADEMTQVAVASNAGALGAAKHLLDGIVAAYPDYAEGWNQRATIEYELGDMDASLADIAVTLALEPRHFGALSGRVLIYLKEGRHADALKDMIAALAIHPYLSEKQLFPELQQDVTHL